MGPRACQTSCAGLPLAHLQKSTDGSLELYESTGGCLAGVALLTVKLEASALDSTWPSLLHAVQTVASPLELVCTWLKMLR